jgi:hypothetical protein
MKALKLTAVSLLLAALVAGPALAAKPAFVTQEATGEAAIVAGNKDKARRDARNNALREAVERVAGVMVSSDTLTANSQLVSDRVFANSAGYVRKHEVLEEKEEGGVMRVTVRAEVGTAELDRDLQAVQALVKRLGNRKLVIVLQEQSSDANKVVMSSGVMAQVLTDAFKADGWRILDPSFAAGKLELASGVSLTTPDKKVIQDLSRADYVLAGTVNFRHQSTADLPGLGKNASIFPVTGEWDMAVFATDSGTQIAKLSGKFNSTPQDLGPRGSALISYERTSFDIAKHRGKEVLAEVRKAVVEHLSHAEQNGNAVVMTVVGLPDYAAVQSFKRVLTQSVTGMRDVKPGSFGSGKAQFDVTFVGSTDELAEQLGGKSFKGKKVSVTGVSGNTVELTLAR